MLFAKRTAIIEKSFLLPQPIPLKVSLSLSGTVSSLLSLFSPLLPSIILLSTCFIFFFFYSSLSLCRLILFSSPLSLSPSLSWSFLVLLFRCHFLSLQRFFVISFLVLVFSHTVIDTHTHTQSHAHINTGINKSSLCEVPEVRERI